MNRRPRRPQSMLITESVRGGDKAILIKSSIDHHAYLALELNSIEDTTTTGNMATGPVKLVAGGPLEPPRVGVSGLRSQDPLEVPSATVSRRGPSGLTAEHPAR
ncbi:hypothetical protein Trydic_g22569 [Trypoxylus dichotomus]